MTAAAALFWHSMDIMVQIEVKAAAVIRMPIHVANTSSAPVSNPPHQRDTYCEGNDKVNGTHDCSCRDAGDQV